VSSLLVVMTATVLFTVVNHLYCKPSYVLVDASHAFECDNRCPVLQLLWTERLCPTPRTRNVKIGAPLELLGPAVCFSNECGIEDILPWPVGAARAPGVHISGHASNEGTYFEVEKKNIESRY
jgi:hypothetical protein